MVLRLAALVWPGWLHMGHIAAVPLLPVLQPAIPEVTNTVNGYIMGTIGYPLYLLPPGNTADPIAAAYVTRQVNTLMAGRARLAALQSVDCQYDVVRLAALVRT